MSNLSPPPSPSSHSSNLSPADAAPRPEPASTAESPLILGRARASSASSRTYQEAQQEMEQERDEEVRRARQQDHAAGGQQEGSITPGELRAEMETLLSLRRRSLSQPVSVDPDLPPPSPTSPTHALSHHPPHASTSTAGRPQLTLKISSPTPSPTGGPVSPTAPTAAETGTLVRRRSSSAKARLPSDHPLPSPPLPSPTSATFSPPTSPDAPSTSSHDLFWLPASLHPELAPQEFKAFIREQTRPDALARRTSMGGRGGYAGAGGGAGRMDRKKSMLRGEYKPRMGDGVGDGTAQRERRPEGLSRTASEGSKRTTTRVDFEELTIRDLQRLEELAAHAEAESATEGEEEGERLGRALRRSLSLNPNLVAAAAAGAHLPHSEPSLADSAANDSDAPLIVHSPGQILRRTARTKIRKAGLPGDGNGHRFGPSRRVRSASGDLSTANTSMDDDDSIGGNTSVDSLETMESLQVASETVDGDPGGRSAASSSSSDQQHEVQYYEDSPVLADDFPPSAVDGAFLDQPLVATPIDLDAPLPPPPSDSPPDRPPLQSPQSHASPLPSAPSPASADYDWSTHHQPGQQQARLPPPQPYVPPPPIVAPLPERRESIPSPPAPASPASSRSGSFGSSDGKKKSGWARLGLGSSKEDKKKSKGKEKEMEKVHEAAARQQQLDREKDARELRDREEKERKEREKEKEKDSGFFGGLFGKRKSEQEHVAPPTPSPPPEIRTPPPPPTASGALAPDGRYINFYRLPIHVERAVYRLSHIKLANPRRPLFEQVLISNLMFWYLSIINKPAAPPAAPAPVPIPVPQLRGGPDDAQSQSQPSQPQGNPERTSSREKRTLSKPATDGQGRRAGNRSAEMPVKQPQFEQQNRQIEQEYGPGKQREGHHSQQHWDQHHSPSQHSQPSQHHQHRSPAVIVAPPDDTKSSSRSPDRTSAPAEMYRARSSTPSPADSDNDDEEDDRPLGTLPSHRESYPPHRPIPVSSYPKPDSGFQVTSRKVSPTISRTSTSSSSAEDSIHRRRVSNISTISAGSFDASDFIDAYSGAPGTGQASPSTSPVLGFKDSSPTLDGLAPSEESAIHAPLFGNVTPRRRGDSLVNLAAGKSVDSDLVRERSRSPPLRQISPVGDY